MKQGAPHHPKMYRLATAAGISWAWAVGIMELLWQFTYDRTPEGDIGKYPDDEICRAVGWKKRPEVLIESLVAAGLVEKCPKNRLVVHDWAENCGDGTHRILARSCRPFCNGQLPSIGSLNASDRQRVISAWKAHGIDISCTRRAHVAYTPTAFPSPPSPSPSPQSPHGRREGAIWDRLGEAFDGLMATGKFPNLTLDMVALVDRDYPGAKFEQNWRRVAEAARVLPGSVVGSPAAWLRKQLADMEGPTKVSKENDPRRRRYKPEEPDPE